MPNVTLYIRKSDMARWRALQNKSEAVHNMLMAIDGQQPTEAPTAATFDRKAMLARQAKERRAKVSSTVATTGDHNSSDKELVVPPAAKNLPASLQHAFVSANSLATKPKQDNEPPPPNGYPCCQQDQPCKHWEWDGNEQAWRNKITGKTKVQ